jgi:hypothetical protein
MSLRLILMNSVRDVLYEAGLNNCLSRLGPVRMYGLRMELGFGNRWSAFSCVIEKI